MTRLTYEPETIAGKAWEGVKLFWEGVKPFGVVVIYHGDLVVTAWCRRYTSGGRVKSIEIDVRLPKCRESDTLINVSAIVEVRTSRDLIPFLENAIREVVEEKQRRMLDAIAGS